MMYDLSKGSLTVERPPGEMFTLAALRSMHDAAVMLSIPTNANLEAVRYVLRDDHRWELTIWWSAPKEAPAPATVPPPTEPAPEAPAQTLGERERAVAAQYHQQLTERYAVNPQQTREGNVT